MLSIEQCIERNAYDFPQREAVACGGVRLSYARLWQAVTQRAADLKNVETRFVVLKATPSADFIIDYFAVHLAGKVAVPMEADADDASMEAMRRRLSECRIPDDAADVLFTTGTTGKSKGVVVSHRAIVANAENLVEAQGFSEGLTFVVAGPLNHIGSLSKVYPVVMVGATLVITEGLKDVNAFFEAFDGGGSRYATFLVPASLRMLMSLSARRLGQLSGKIEFVETGAAPMSQADMERLCALLPASRLYNTYASTETGIIATHDYNAGKCVAGCLGRAMRNSSFCIGDDGKVVCRGATLMSGYVDDAEATAEIMHDGAVYTNDCAFVDSDGMLNLRGRDGDVINVGGYKIAPEEVEDAAMSIPGIEDCVCVAEPNPIMGNLLKLLVVMADSGTLDKRVLARQLAARLPREKVPMLYAVVTRINRTFNGKIDRKSYRKA